MKFIDLGPKWHRLIPVGQLGNILTMSYGDNNGKFYALIRFNLGGATHDVSSIPFSVLSDAWTAMNEAAAKLSAGTP